MASNVPGMGAGRPFAGVDFTSLFRVRAKGNEFGEKGQKVRLKSLVVVFDLGDGVEETTAPGKPAGDPVERIAHVLQADVTSKPVLRDHAGQDVAQAFREQRAMPAQNSINPVDERAQLHGAESAPMAAQKMVITYIDDNSREAAPRGGDAISTPAGDAMGVRIRIDSPMKSDRLRDCGAETAFGTPFDKITQQAAKNGIIVCAGKKSVGKKIHRAFSSSGAAGGNRIVRCSCRNDLEAISKMRLAVDGGVARL